MSGPDLDATKLSAALGQQGMLLEADAFFMCRRHGWKPLHGFVYRDGDDTREIDVLAVSGIPFENPTDSKRPLAGQVFLFIECKYATNWWVFVDLSEASALPGDFAYPTRKKGLGRRVLDTVVPETLKDLGAEAAPDRAWSARELSFDYGRAKREQFYGASQQALSAMRGFEIYNETSGLAAQSPTLHLFVPVVMTSSSPIVARAEEGSEGFDVVESDWVIAGSPRQVVHVVTLDGLGRLLTFLNKLIENLASPGAYQLIQTLFTS